MPYSYEYDRKLRVGFIGAGDQAYRNILPSFQYAPLELIALADEDEERGLAVARQFGARHYYPNHKALLAKERMDAVFIVTGPDSEGRPRYPELASEALRAGYHVWVAPPPCATEKEISAFTDACMASRKYVMTGFKRMFAPAYLKVAQIIEDTAFGGVSTFYMRYPLALPAEGQREAAQARAAFLEFVHPYALLSRLFGECEGFTVMRSDKTGGGVITFRYRSGIVGSLHLTSGQALSSPLERLEVVGNGANVVVENGVRLTYYRKGGAPGDDQTLGPDVFIGADANAPIVWEPEFSMGQVYNKQLVLQGYVGCIRHFAERLLQEEAPRHGNLVDMLHIMTVHDRVLAARENAWTPLY